MENVSFVLEKEDRYDYHPEYGMVYAGTQKSDVETLVKEKPGNYRLSIWLSGFLSAQYMYDGRTEYPKWELVNDILGAERDAISDIEEEIEEKRAEIAKMEREVETRQKALDEKEAEFAKVDF